MSENTKLVLNSLKKNPKGLTAYQILNNVQKFKNIQPMTIYRALNSLTTNGLIHKTNKNKTFHLCDTAHVCNTTEAHEHNAVLAVCNDCGVAEELKTDLFSKIIKNIKSKKRFNFNNFNLEITTTCKECN
ncbi:transcriptional repressor [Pelagibacteraceae bacterium]|jgi:Fur family zinc uptake transcriptional regulator|nr:transcriptional repressor [Pelagibacteraceae bacterium]|tara:strand:+ start:104 stop:493 length:390 start_codon:yes stop_codon:yes gene_type:complete